jgi:type I restriction enzyme S subunit
MAKFQTVSLSEVTTLVTKGTTPTTLGYAFTDSGVNFIKAESVTLDGQIDESVFAHIDEATHKKLKRSQIEEGDILFSIAGMKLGKSAVVKSWHVPANTNQAVAIIRTDRSKALPEFLHYHFLNPDHYRYVNAITAQAAQPNINLGQVGNLPISLPPLPVQRRIAGILSAYDELMENSQRRIRLLEAMARALYREWFVHFRFPGHEKHPRVASPLGDIPQGWEVKKLGDTFKTVLGGTPSRVRSEFWEGGTIPWINSGKVNDLRITAPSELITELALKRSAAKLMPKGTTVLAITGATLGQVSYLEIETTANQSVVGIVDPSGLYSEWIYLTVADRIEGIINHASGGAQQHINKEVVNDVLVAPPPAPQAKEFKRLVGPMFREVATLLFKIQNLRRTRDLLLPRLLSGQVNLKEG